MSRIDIAGAPRKVGSAYPPPLDERHRTIQRIKLAAAGGLSQFGVNLTRLPHGDWSSQRHWHIAEDEFVFVLEGEAVLVTGQGEQTLKAGDCAAFPAGLRDGHHLQNRSAADVLLLEIGSRRPAQDACHFPDQGLAFGRGAVPVPYLNEAAA